MAKSLASKLLGFMFTAHYAVDDLSRESGLSANRIRAYLSNTVSHPDVGEIKLMCQIMLVPPKELEKVLALLSVPKSL